MKKKMQKEDKMTFEKVLDKARAMADKADISGIGFMAVQINVAGEGPGVFYVEVKDGRISVEPYEYYDRQCAITISGDDFDRLIQGRIDPGKAYDEGRIRVDGDLDTALKFSDLVRNNG
jgi:putative sterol carrier protein